MTNIAHQEFLNSLKEEIQRQKLSGQYGRKNLDKLLTFCLLYTSSKDVIQVVGTELQAAQWEKIKEEILLIN